MIYFLPLPVVFWRGALSPCTQQSVSISLLMMNYRSIGLNITGLRSWNLRVPLPSLWSFRGLPSCPLTMTVLFMSGMSPFPCFPICVICLRSLGGCDTYALYLLSRRSSCFSPWRLLAMPCAVLSLLILGRFEWRLIAHVPLPLLVSHSLRP